jgi:hypothetical protein
MQISPLGPWSSTVSRRRARGLTRNPHPGDREFDDLVPASAEGTGQHPFRKGMIDRLAALGGELLVRSEPGSGTTVAGTLPV